MAIYDLTQYWSTLLPDATDVIDRVYEDIPLLYRIKEIVVVEYIYGEYISGTAVPVTITPTVTIDSPRQEGRRAAGVAIMVDNRATHVAPKRVMRIGVADPGCGYASVPNVTVERIITSSTPVYAPDNVTITHYNVQWCDTVAAALIETDPESVMRREHAMSFIQHRRLYWAEPNDAIARGLMMLNLKATNSLDDLRAELANPTVL